MSGGTHLLASLCPWTASEQASICVTHALSHAALPACHGGQKVSICASTRTPNTTKEHHHPCSHSSTLKALHKSPFIFPGTRQLRASRSSSPCWSRTRHSSTRAGRI
eukprot:GHVR01112632.1.p1 GENE.GHVR01112632.1~~GHVR01112632.1.p1  ORF type:complete len:107 (-),score=3.62 GHVR01112632.1:17-337(-)